MALVAPPRSPGNCRSTRFETRSEDFEIAEKWMSIEFQRLKGSLSFRLGRIKLAPKNGGKKLAGKTAKSFLEKCWFSIPRITSSGHLTLNFIIGRFIQKRFAPSDSSLTRDTLWNKCLWRQNYSNSVHPTYSKVQLWLWYKILRNFTLFVVLP